LRAATFETLIGLMAATGLRAGEALGLDRAAVDLQDGALHVRHGKHGKQREVPLHDTTIRRLRDYSQLRDLLLPQPATAAFFVSHLGSRLTANAFNRWFASSSNRSAWKEPGSEPARGHMTSDTPTRSAH
jgi:integrase/recombinase XerD